MSKDPIFMDIGSNEVLLRYIASIAKGIAESTTPTALVRTARYPAGAGVYCIFQDGKPIYVGESGDLPSRMGDIFKTLNHSFRRSLGEHLYAKRPGFSAASAKKHFPDDLELELTEYMETKLAFVASPLILGRKEVEEFIIESYQPTFNERGRRRS